MYSLRDSGCLMALGSPGPTLRANPGLVYRKGKVLVHPRANTNIAHRSVSRPTSQFVNTSLARLEFAKPRALAASSKSLNSCSLSESRTFLFLTLVEYDLLRPKFDILLSYSRLDPHGKRSPPGRAQRRFGTRPSHEGTAPLANRAVSATASFIKNQRSRQLLSRPSRVALRCNFARA